MKIAEIEIIRIAIPFDSSARDALDTADQDAFNAASPNISSMESLLVRVVCDTGHIGWGEAFGHGANPLSFVALKELVCPAFIGTHVAEREQTLYSATRALHSFGQNGPINYALAAMDIALWDLAAQRAQQPLYAFMGGRPRPLDLYASLVSYQNQVPLLTDAVQAAARAGYRRIKLHETGFESISAARAALPASVELMVDTNCPWTRAQAQAQASRLSPLGLTWLEEPIWPPDDVHGLAALRALGVPLAAGENAGGLAGFLSLFENRAIDVAQPSVAKIGLTTALEVIAQAKHHDVKVVPHCFYYGPGMLAAAHLATLLPPEVALEVPFLHFQENLHPMLDYQPVMTLQDTPGLGFRPQPGCLEQYRIAGARLS